MRDGSRVLEWEGRGARASRSVLARILGNDGLPSDRVDPVPGEGAGARLRRRLITVPAVGLLAMSFLLASPVVLPVAAAVDLIGRRTCLTRAYILATFYLVMEVTGLFGSALIGILDGILAPDPSRLGRWSFALQHLWTQAVLQVAFALYRIEVEVTYPRWREDRPIVLLSRHQGLFDSLLPVHLLTGRHGIFLRHVYKRELLWDPCIDVNGHRVPGYFVERSGSPREREVSGIARVARRLLPGEGVAFFPEGTRFTPAKRAQVIDSLRRKGDRTALARALDLERVLPIRPAGTLALLRTAPDADLVFCAHRGLEGIDSPRDLLWRRSLGRRLVVHFWRVPREEVPSGDVPRMAWLHREWKKVDGWLAGGCLARVPARSRAG